MQVPLSENPTQFCDLLNRAEGEHQEGDEEEDEDEARLFFTFFCKGVHIHITLI
jgi:hypothetical protein